MSFLETVEKARAFLERNERVSLRALQREFDLDDGVLDELRAELAHARGDAAGRERHLREAHRLYTEMGAAGHAERMAKELGL